MPLGGGGILATGEGGAASPMEAVAMSPSSVSSHIYDAASITDDMSLQEGLLFSDTLKVCAMLFPSAQNFSLLVPMDLSRQCFCPRASFLDFCLRSRKTKCDAV